jgi:hypothetical protein
MRVGIHEAGHHGGAAQVDDPRAAVAPASHLGAAAHRRHAAAGDGERGDERAPRVEREDPAAVENEVGGYFIQPFSRYAFSAPGCSGMPTLSGCQAVFGSNPARPAWPRTSASLFSSTVFVTV